MNRYCYNAETTDIKEWLTAAHKLRNQIDEGTRGAVDVHEESWYIQKKAHCHLIGTPSNPVAVYAITENLELVSLIKSPKSIILGSWLVCDAVAHGAGWLMCLDTPHLSKIYKNAGFKRVADMRWSDEYAPVGWNYAKHGRPYLSYYVHTNFMDASATGTFDGCGRYMAPSTDDAEARVLRIID